MIVTAEFATLAHTMAANAGRSGLRVLALPYPLETQPEASVRAIASEHWDALLARLGATTDG